MMRTQVPEPRTGVPPAENLGAPGRHSGTTVADPFDQDRNLGDQAWDLGCRGWETSDP